MADDDFDYNTWGIFAIIRCLISVINPDIVTIKSFYCRSFKIKNIPAAMEKMQVFTNNNIFLIYGR